MKKTLLLLAGLSFLIPMTASATLVGTGTMNIDWSSPNVNASFNNGSNYGWYYGDADIISTSYSGPTLKSLEAFCVEKSDYLPGKTYTFWSIDTASFGSAGTNGTKTIYDKYVEATWLANHALTASGDSDTNKAIAQAAIWSTVIDGAIISSSWSHYQDVQNLLSLFSGATNKNQAKACGVICSALRIHHMWRGLLKSQLAMISLALSCAYFRNFSG